MKNITYISAGAGSGKTYSLTEKLMDFVKTGECSMREVILTTFTDTAAADFKKKTREKFIQNGYTAEASSLDSALIGTVHSIGFKFIKKYWYKLGLSASVDVLDDVAKEAYINAGMDGLVDQADIDIFHQYAETHNIKPMMSNQYDYNFWKEDVKAIIEKSDAFDVNNLIVQGYKRSTILNNTYAVPEGYDIDPVCKTIYRIAVDLKNKFAQYKKDHSLIEFNDMERYFLQLLKDDEVKKEIRDSIKYVFVDEFQDSSPIQLEIFDRLSEIVKRSFWVGDEKQAIYGFRGCDTLLVQAVTKYIKDNHNKHWETEGGFGFENQPNSWRSVPSLVTLSNNIFPDVLRIPQNDMELKAKREEFAPCSMYHIMFQPGITKTGKQSFSKEVAAVDMAHMVKRIIDLETEIKTVVDKDSKECRTLTPSDIAILCRSNYDIANLRHELQLCGVPVKTDSEIESDYREVKLLISLLYYFILDKALLRAEIEHLLVDESLAHILTQKNNFSSLFEKLDTLKENMKYEPVSKIVRTLVLHMNLDVICAKWGNWNERRQRLLTLVDNAIKYEDDMVKRGGYASIQGFISYIEGGNCNVSTSADGVTLTTYHKSKGLEWNIVILYSFDNDAKKNTLKFYLSPDAERISVPTSEAFYSDYNIRYLTRFTGSASLPSIESSNEFNVKLESALAEENRLLYVGVTRARDYLLTCSFNKVAKLTWLANAGFTSKLGTEEASIFGHNIPFKVINAPYEETPSLTQPSSYEVPEQAPECTETSRKFLSPSQIEGSDGANVTLLNETCSVERITITSSGHTDSEIGTCLHNALALCRVGKNQANQEAVEKVICNYGMQSVFTDQNVKDKIAKMYDLLSQELTEKYGICIKEEHELPFCFTSESNERVNGIIDMLWYTQDGVVIVDYKSYQGKISEFMTPGSQFYAGKYSSQLALYKKALELAGHKVLGTLIYYAVQGKIVSVV